MNYILITYAFFSVLFLGVFTSEPRIYPHKSYLQGVKLLFTEVYFDKERFTIFGKFIMYILVLVMQLLLLPWTILYVLFVHIPKYIIKFMFKGTS
jgi:hypothetical protein